LKHTPLDDISVGCILQLNLSPNEQFVGCAAIAFSERFIPDDDLVQVETCMKDINDK